MDKIFLVGLGGFVGSNLRYWTAIWLGGRTFPLATFAVADSQARLCLKVLRLGQQSSGIEPKKHVNTPAFRPNTQGHAKSEYRPQKAPSVQLY